MLINNRKLSILFFIFLFSIFSVILDVSAVGISARPLSPTVFYEPDKEYNFNYELLASSTQIMDYSIIIQNFQGSKSDLTPYVSVEPSKFEKVTPGTKPLFKVKLRLPSTPLEPGLHRVLVGAEESLSTGGEFGIKTQASDVINVISLFPGKYLEVRLKSTDANEGQPVDFTVTISNYGTEDLTKIDGIIEIYDQSGSKIGTAQTDSKPLKSKETDTLTATFDTTGLKAGNYKAVAKISYDGKEAEKSEATFRIGTLNIEIISFTQSVKPGTINKFDVKIKSGWGEQISNVYAEVKIGTSKFNTLPINIPPFVEATLSGFFDTSAVTAGDYDATITVFYAGKTTSTTGKVSVTEKTTAPQTQTPKAEIKVGGEGKKTNWLLIIIIILVVGIGGYFGYGYWQSRQEEETQPQAMPAMPGVQPVQPQAVQPVQQAQPMQAQPAIQQPTAEQQVQPAQPQASVQPAVTVPITAKPKARPKRKAARKKRR